MSSVKSLQTNYQDYFDIFEEYSLGTFVSPILKLQKNTDYKQFNIASYNAQSSFEKALKTMEDDNLIKIESKLDNSFFIRFNTCDKDINWSDIFQVNVFTLWASYSTEFILNYISSEFIIDLIGLVANHYQLKLNIEGLYKTIYFNKDGQPILTGDLIDVHSSQDILLTQKWQEVLEYLGFDYDCWKNGFNNNMEAAEFILNCKSLNSDLLNKIISMLQEKNGNLDYIDFLSKIKICAKKHTNFKYSNIGDLKSLYIHFPSFPIKYREAVKDKKTNIQYQSRINNKRIFKILNQINCDIIDGKIVNNGNIIKISDNVKFSSLMIHVANKMKWVITLDILAFSLKSKSAHSKLSNKEWDEKIKKIVIDWLMKH